MNLKELSRIDVKDLKNVNWGEVLEFFKTRWDISIQFVVIIASIFVCLWAYNTNKGKLADLSIQVKTAQEKLAKLNELQEVEEFSKKIFDALPPEISEKRLINLMADLAKKYNIRIHSFSPGEPIKKERYTVLPLTLALSSQNYKSIWTFIEQVETLPDAITIQNFGLNSNPSTGQPARRSGGGSAAEGLNGNDNINVTVTLHAVSFIKNE